MLELPRITVPILLPCRDPARFVPEILMAEMREISPAAELQHYADQLDGLIIFHAQACGAPFRRGARRRIGWIFLTGSMP